MRLNTEDNEYDVRMLSFMLVQKAMFVYDDACLGDDESRLSELVRLLRDELVSEPDWLSCKLLLLGFAWERKCLCGRSFGLLSSW